MCKEHTRSHQYNLPHKVQRQLIAANYGAAVWLIVGVDPSQIEWVLDRNDGLVAATLGPIIAPQSLSSAAYNSNW